MSDMITTAEYDGVFECVLDRPAKYNAINLEMADALFGHVECFASMPHLRAMLIRAEGRYFSAGVDLTDEAMFGSEAARNGPASFRKWYRNGVGSLHPLGDALEAVEKPVVVAHQGPCLGGALELSLSCDFRLASGSARYGLPEINLGVLPGSGGTSRLTRLVGSAWARWLIMAGEQIDADRALAIGLVQAVIDDAEFRDRARAFAIRLAQQPPEAIAAAKLAIDLVSDLGRAESRNVERIANSLLTAGDEHKRQVSLALSKIRK